jgi:hypothetical protein
MQHAVLVQVQQCSSRSSTISAPENTWALGDPVMLACTSG